MRVLSFVTTALLVFVASGFWFVQVVRGSYYRDLAENNRLRKRSIEALRGQILDLHGRILAGNVASYDLYLDREHSSDLDGSVERAAAHSQVGTGVHTGEHQHGHGVAVGFSNRRCGVGHARTGDQKADARATGSPRVAVRHEARALFVANADMANAGAFDLAVELQRMDARNAEDGIDLVGSQLMQQSTAARHVHDDSPPPLP